MGCGLLAAGAVLFLLQLVGMYLNDSEPLQDALDPLALRRFLAYMLVTFLPMLPGAFLIWLGNLLERHRAEN